MGLTIEWMKWNGHSSHRETIVGSLQRDNFPSYAAIALNCMVSSFRGERDSMWLMCLLHFCIQIKLTHYVPFEWSDHLTQWASWMRNKRRERDIKYNVSVKMWLGKRYVRGNHWKRDCGSRLMDVVTSRCSENLQEQFFFVYKIFDGGVCIS